MCSRPRRFISPSQLSTTDHCPAPALPRPARGGGRRAIFRGTGISNREKSADLYSGTQTRQEERE